MVFSQPLWKSPACAITFSSAWQEGEKQHGRSQGWVRVKVYSARLKVSRIFCVSTVLPLLLTLSVGIVDW